MDSPAILACVYCMFSNLVNKMPAMKYDTEQLLMKTAITLNAVAFIWSM